jgi:hypothetical protein
MSLGNVVSIYEHLTLLFVARSLYWLMNLLLLVRLSVLFIFLFIGSTGV